MLLSCLFRHILKRPEFEQGKPAVRRGVDLKICIFIRLLVPAEPGLPEPQAFRHVVKLGLNGLDVGVSGEHRAGEGYDCIPVAGHRNVNVMLPEHFIRPLPECQTQAGQDALLEG